MSIRFAKLLLTGAAVTAIAAVPGTAHAQLLRPLAPLLPPPPTTTTTSTTTTSTTSTSTTSSSTTTAATPTTAPTTTSTTTTTAVTNPLVLVTTVTAPIVSAPVVTAPVTTLVSNVGSVASPLYGDINPFWGDINPFYGDINPFYGDINPFWGDINPFYGDINPFHGDINPFYGDINPFWGDINPFWGDINPFYGDINPFEGDINPFNQNAPGLTTMGNYWQGFGNAWKDTESLWTNPLLGASLVLKMNTVIAEAQSTWGASIQAQSGQSFNQAFLNPLLARYGINPNDATSMQALSANQRSQFFLDWYDSLMAFAGMDRIDHWMASIHWTPAITQQQGSGADSIIGLLDATPMNDPDIADNVSWIGGGTAVVNGHGVGVASLMVAAHDRQGVMGIAPNATVIAYNPYDESNTASWEAIRAGILSLTQRGASVINMSLGVPGYTLHPAWHDVFADSAVAAASAGRVFVIAAGNSGTTQTQNVAWDVANGPSLILVGSVDVNGDISTFSNRPGNACLTDAAGVCQQALMDRFMVAPGELILLPDGNGGFVRRSGTSFAAPLVSGAITLLHDRWPWLAQHPQETVDIILQSARDLGAPGVDAVYGHGLLDVAASQSPLDYNNLQFYEVRDGVVTARTAAELQASGVETTWETDGVYFHLYEPIGSTFRDFTVPMSALLTGQVRTQTGAMEYFQRFARRGLTDFINAGGTTTFADTAMISMPAVGRLQVSVAAVNPEGLATGARSRFSSHSAVRLSDVSSGLGFTAGFGNGALMMNAQQGLAMTTDHSRDGGVNPLLALASGGAFANVDLPLGRATTLSFGVTRDHQVDVLDDPLNEDTQMERAARRGLQPLDAEAMNVRLTHRVTPSLTLSGSYSRIREANSLLGVQSRERTDFSGATSETATLGASLQPSRNLTLAASATLGRSRTGGTPEQGFVTNGEGVISTAWAISATRANLLRPRDAMRLSVSQPLHIEGGELAYRSVEVIDRTTGELGVVDRPFHAAGDPRSMIAEMLYETPIIGGQGALGLFGRLEVQPRENMNVDQYSIGGRLSVRF